MIDWTAAGTVLAGISMASMGVSYGFRAAVAPLRSRLDGHDQLFDEREKLAENRHDDIKADLQEIKMSLRERPYYGQTTR